MSTGRSSYECPSYLEPAQGLCLAKGHPSYECSNISIADALSLEVIDVNWSWDRFTGTGGSVQWRCRGESTGKFADDSKCSNKMKNDDTWPAS